MGRRSGIGDGILFFLIFFFCIFWIFLFSYALDSEHSAEIFFGICFGVPAVIGLGYVAVQNHRDTEEAKKRRKKDAPAMDEIKRQREAGSRKEIADRLDQLTELYQDGRITEEEYQYARRKILDEL